MLFVPRERVLWWWRSCHLDAGEVLASYVFNMRGMHVKHVATLCGEPCGRYPRRGCGARDATLRMVLVEMEEVREAKSDS